MADFEKMYFHLFNAVTDAIEHARAGRSEEVKNRLMTAHQECEEIYVSDNGSTMTVSGVSARDCPRQIFSKNIEKQA